MAEAFADGGAARIAHPSWSARSDRRPSKQARATRFETIRRPDGWPVDFAQGEGAASTQSGSQNGQISDSYRQVFDRLEPRYRSKLLDSQRRWLKGRIASSELKAVLAARLDDLKNAIITVNGLTFLRLSGTGRPPYLINALPGAQAYNQ